MGRWLSWQNTAFLLIVFIGVTRIAATYSSLVHTIDEPIQIACGLEWLEQHNFTFDKQHPPLPRIAVAIGAKLAGVKLINKKSIVNAHLMLYEAPSYERAIAWARAGELPFFILGATAVWLWSRKLHGDLAALASVLLFTSLPPVLAHAGLANTDIATCGTLIAAAYAWVLWLEDCSVRNTVSLGFFAALSFLSKFTFIVFFPILALTSVALIGQWRMKGRWMSLGAAFALFCFIVWGFYWFRFTPVSTSEEAWGFIPMLPKAVQDLITRQPSITLPAGFIYEGLLEARKHIFDGHLSYLFGKFSRHGWWYFFPVVLFFKTTLPFLALAISSPCWLRKLSRRDWIPFAASVLILLSVLPGTINLGIRHILIILALLSIPAGLVLSRLLLSPSSRLLQLTGALLLLWHLGAGIRSHPNYISYFNELALDPEYIRVDSDLDWGQTAKQTADALMARRDKAPFGVSIWGSSDLWRHGLGEDGNYIANPWRPTTGWLAISASQRYIPMDPRPPGEIRGPWYWLQGYEPTERLVGGAVLLYYVPK